MITFIIAAAIGAVVKTLLPFPPLDDRIRAAWAWARGKIT